MPAPLKNKYALGNNGGRPPFYADAETLEAKVNEYFTYCLKNEENPKITGLTLFLGFSELKSLDDYEKKEEFVHIIKRARLCVQLSYEDLLLSCPAGAIFALKNMGWKDKQEVESKNTNTNYNSEPLTPEKIKEINQSLEKDY